MPRWSVSLLVFGLLLISGGLLSNGWISVALGVWGSGALVGGAVLYADGK